MKWMFSPLRWCFLCLTPSKEREERSLVANGSYRSNTESRPHTQKRTLHLLLVVSGGSEFSLKFSLKFWERTRWETSLVTNYRNDPWKCSLMKWILTSHTPWAVTVPLPHTPTANWSLVTALPPTLAAVRRGTLVSLTCCLRFCYPRYRLLWASLGLVWDMSG